MRQMDVCSVNLGYFWTQTKMNVRERNAIKLNHQFTFSSDIWKIIRTCCEMVKKAAFYFT